MARTEKPIPPDSGVVGELADRLRRYRARTGLSYRQLAARAHVSYPHLARAASGTSVPTWETTEAYLRGCGITGPRSLEAFRRLWETAARSGNTKSRPRKRVGALAHITTREEFGKHLQKLAFREAGWMSRREIAAMTEQSKTSISDWIAGKAMPEVESLDQFAGMFGATEAEKADLREVRLRLLLGPRPDTAGTQMLEALESSVDDDTFVRTLLTVLDGTVTVEHPAIAVAPSGPETRYVNRRAAGSLPWKPADGERLGRTVEHIRNAADAIRPRPASS